MGISTQKMQEKLTSLKGEEDFEISSKEDFSEGSFEDQLFHAITNKHEITIVRWVNNFEYRETYTYDKHYDVWNVIVFDEEAIHVKEREEWLNS